MRVVLSGQERIMNAVKTDVIIPAYHPGEEFDKLLERLSAQKYPVNKIIVMNTEKKFWRENWEQKYPLVEVHHLTKQEFDHGATRRRGAELSDAEILIFMTQDALPADRNLVGNLVQAVDEIGGFPEHAIFNEDMIYAGWMVKKGYAVAYAAEAKVYHSHNYSCSQQFHRNFDLGVSQAEHPEVFEGVPSEGEGVRLVKKSLSYLLKTGHIWMIPGLFFQSASKYAGYFLGKRYQKLPERLILFCTMSPEYWKKQK